MELLECSQQGHSSTSSPYLESRNQVYESICEATRNVEVIETSAAPPAPRTGRRTRYAITSFLNDCPISGFILASIYQVFFATALFPSSPPY